MPTPRRALLGVSLASYPLNSGGLTWAYLHWALALRDAGYDVWLVESLEQKKCINAGRRPCAFTGSANAAHWNEIITRFGFENRNTLWVDQEQHGASGVEEFASTADLFLNVSGHFKRHEVVSPVPVRIYLDLDPVFTQIWAEDYGSDMNFAGHTHFFTVGLNLPGNPSCPQAGQAWLPTLFPVSLTHWPVQSFIPPDAPWTTLTHWYGYPPVQHAKEWYDNKSEEFVKLRETAAFSPRTLEIATDLVSNDNMREAFTKAAWKITVAADYSDPWTTYPQYLRSSFGEFSAAKNGYVKSSSGWFSDRSVAYLASGLPVVLQDTGWTKFLPSDCGLLGFRTVEEAVERLHQVEREPARHRQAARAVAEDYFAGPKVIQKMMERVGG